MCIHVCVVCVYVRVCNSAPHQVEVPSWLVSWPSFLSFFELCALSLYFFLFPAYRGVCVCAYTNVRSVYSYVYMNTPPTYPSLFCCISCIPFYGVCSLKFLTGRGNKGGGGRERENKMEIGVERKSEYKKEIGAEGDDKSEEG